MGYRIFAFLTVVAVLIGSLLLARQSSTPPAAMVTRSAVDEGYSARSAKLWQTGANGLPLYTLKAALIRARPRQKRVQLTQVILNFHDPSGNRWSATARRGAIVRGTGRVELAGDVRVTAALRGAHAPLRIHTAALTFHSHADRVSTARPVTVLWAGQRLEATGLVVNLKTQHLQLESHVHAIVTPSR